MDGIFPSDDAILGTRETKIKSSNLIVGCYLNS
jgi:hypothetical protein